MAEACAVAFAEVLRFVAVGAFTLPVQSLTIARRERLHQVDGLLAQLSVRGADHSEELGQDEPLAIQMLLGTWPWP